MTVNPSTMRLGIASILIGLVGAYGVRLVMEEDEAPPAEVKKIHKVPLANQDLPVGRVLRKGDMSIHEMTMEQMKQKGMPLDLVMMAPEEIIGRRLRKPLQLGEPFLTNAVWLQDVGPEYELKPGYRAVAVTVSLARGAYAEANDVVDVFFTSTPRPADEKIGRRAIPETTIRVAEAITILEVTRPDSTALQAMARQHGSSATFLLQVLPDLVSTFQALHGHGEFSFLLRPDNDESLAKNSGSKGTSLEDILGLEEEVPPPQQPIWVTEYYRGGSRSGQQFPIPPQYTPEQIAEMERLYKEEQAKLAAASGGGDPIYAEAPVEDRRPLPAPVRRRPVSTLREPAAPSGGAQIPYRGDEPATRKPLPRSSATPLPRRSPLTASDVDDAANPFGDDDASDVLP